MYERSGRRIDWVGPGKEGGQSHPVDVAYLLRAEHNRPHRCATYERYEFPPLHLTPFVGPEETIRLSALIVLDFCIAMRRLGRGLVWIILPRGGPLRGTTAVPPESCRCCDGAETFRLVPG